MIRRTFRHNPRTRGKSHHQANFTWTMPTATTVVSVSHALLWTANLALHGSILEREKHQQKTRNTEC